MIYSRWNPSGGYSYYENSDQIALAADLPIPRFPETPLGVPSVLAGRPLPANAVFVGTGSIARGLVVPTLRNGGLGALAINSAALGYVAIGTALGVALTWFWKRWKK